MNTLFIFAFTSGVIVSIAMFSVLKIFIKIFGGKYIVRKSYNELAMRNDKFVAEALGFEIDLNKERA